MSLLSCHRLSHSVGTKPLFADISFDIEARDRIGLVGHNGSGKSTLLALIAGETTPESGEFARQQGFNIPGRKDFLLAVNLAGAIW